MCGRFSLRTPTETLARFFDSVRFPVLSPRYNIAPTQLVLCLRSRELGMGRPSDRSTDCDQTQLADDYSSASNGAIEAVQLRWGLIPSWAKDLKIGAKMINARSETVAEKPAFRAAFKRRRCLVLADGFYEWSKDGGRKQPWYISSADPQQPLLCFAGLWETWHPPERVQEQPLLFSADQNEDFFDQSTAVQSCTIITTTANDTMSPLHDRMPVILDDQDQRYWLDNQINDGNRLKDLLVPCTDDRLRVYPVDNRVNRASFEDASCIAPIQNGDG